MLKGLLLGIVLGVLLLLGGAFFYFSTGRAPVAVASPQMPLERKLAGMALHAYLDKLPHSAPQVPEDEKNFLEGAKVYKQHCAVCHGLPGEPKTVIAEGMFPKPPQLFRGVGVTDDEAWETYWKVSGGIRMTGMPGFKERLSDAQMWQVSVLVKNADKIPASVKAELAAPGGPPMMSPATTPAAKPEAADDDHGHEHVH